MVIRFIDTEMVWYESVAWLIFAKPKRVLGAFVNDG